MRLGLEMYERSFGEDLLMVKSAGLTSIREEKF